MARDFKMNPQLQKEISDLIRPTPPRMPMEGWCTQEKAMELAALVLQTKPVCIVELGVFGGRSLLPQVLALRENGSGMAFGIDTWNAEISIENFDGTNPDDARQIAWWGQVDMHEIYRGCARMIEALKLDDFVALIRGRSELIADRFALESIDVLHIDGDHQESSSCRDVVLWLPRVRPGGWIWFDDTNWPQTQAALRLLEGVATMAREVTVGESQFRLYQKTGK